MKGLNCFLEHTVSRGRFTQAILSRNRPFVKGKKNYFTNGLFLLETACVSQLILFYLVKTGHSSWVGSNKKRNGCRFSERTGSGEQFETVQARASGRVRRLQTALEVCLGSGLICLQY